MRVCVPVARVFIWAGGIPSSLPSSFSAGGLSESRKEETGKEICVYTVGLGGKEEVEISGPCKYSIRTEKFKINVQHGISLILCLREEGNIFCVSCSISWHSWMERGERERATLTKRRRRNSHGHDSSLEGKKKIGIHQLTNDIF